MNGQNTNSQNNSTLKSLLMLGLGAGAGILVFELVRRRLNRTRSANAFSPLVDSIIVTKDGVTSGLMTFGWDDEENCSWARSVTVDGSGAVIGESLIEVEVYEDKILTFQGTGEVGDTPIVANYNLDEYGMVDLVSVRCTGGKEQRYDSTVVGAELKKSVTDDRVISYEWQDGNLVGIRTTGGNNIRMSYYKNVENHLFPDLNALSMPFAPDMLMTYVMGTRSRNYLATMEIEAEDRIEHSSFSYLCDKYDRPVQIIQETTVVSEPEVSDHARTTYDIKYLNN